MKGVFGNEGALRFCSIRIAPEDFAIRFIRSNPMPSALPPEEDHPGVPIAPPLLFVIPIVASLALEWFVPTSVVHGAFRWMLGATLSLGGLALTVDGFITQKRAGTDPIPFHPSTRVVVHGLYRFTRNPMYLGFALFTLGLALMVDSAWLLLAALIGIILIDRLVIVREERYLERKFGAEYLGYKHRVRRWI
jgi:protein-S-isoprenylcysteine O-methyltransferase Ste14